MIGIGRRRRRLDVHPCAGLRGANGSWSSSVAEKATAARPAQNSPSSPPFLRRLSSLPPQLTY